MLVQPPPPPPPPPPTHTHTNTQKNPNKHCHHHRHHHHQPPRPEQGITIWLSFTAHYSDDIMSTMASQITDVSIICSTVCSGAAQRQKSKLLVRGIHRWSVDSPNKEPVTRKLFPFDVIIMDMIAPRVERMNMWWRTTNPWECTQHMPRLSAWWHLQARS